MFQTFSVIPDRPEVAAVMQVTQGAQGAQVARYLPGDRLATRSATFVAVPLSAPVGLRGADVCKNQVKLPLFGGMIGERLRGDRQYLV